MGVTNDRRRRPGGSTVTGAELRERRQQAGLTQRELAAIADCSLASVANMEHGAVPKSSAVLTRVLGVLDAFAVGRS